MPSPSTRSRILCSNCMQSFEPTITEDSAAPSICPACAARWSDRTATAQSAGREGSRQEDTVQEDPDQEASPTAARFPANRFPAPTPNAARPDPESLGFWGDSAAWATGKWWWARLPLSLYFGVVFSRHVFGTGPYRSLFDGINLGIHELGHAVFRPFGEFMHMSGGTILQLAAPVAAGIVFLRQRDYFGISVALCWLATNFWGVAEYVGDARALKLDLVAPGMGVMPAGEGGILHDWNHLLGPMGLLPYDQHFAFFFKTCAVASMLTGLVYGAWLMFVMFTRKGPSLPYSQS